MSVLKTHHTNHTLVITISRPDSMNALNAEVLDGLGKIIQEAYQNNTVKGIIVTGEGDKAFVAGADIKELSSLNQEQAFDLAQKGQKLSSSLENCPKPIIAAVNGFALGGGCELALACHIRIASENAKFGQPEVNLGIIPGYGGTQRLTRVLGRTLATDLILTSRMMDAREALEQGLIARITTLEDLLPTAKEMASAIASKAPLAISAALECIVEGIDETIEEGLGREA